jgi:hypothetical protein
MTAKGKDNFLGFRSHPHPESPDGILAEYLGSRDGEGSKKEAMLRAIRSYWLPLALEDAGLRGRELEKAGYEAVLDLIKQAHYICAVLGLERERLGLGTGAVVSVAPEPSPSSAGEAPKKLSTHPWDEILGDFQSEDLGFENWPKN